MSGKQLLGFEDNIRCIKLLMDLINVMHHNYQKVYFNCIESKTL